MKRTVALVIMIAAIPAVVSAQGPFEFVVYGDAVVRDNNLAGRAFQSTAGFNPEARLLYGDRALAERPRPYLKANLSYTSGNIAEENTATYGFGVEIRPLITQYTLRRPSTEWLMNTRFFAEYLEQGFFRGSKPSWSPRHDWVVGMDLWKEFGAVDPTRPDNPDRHWAELFLGAAWHDTDFFEKGYHSLRYGLNVRAGTVNYIGGFRAMPYLMVDVNGSTPRNYAFQNRVIGALGLRTEFPLGSDRRSLSKLKLFVEQRYVLSYFRKHPESSEGVPYSDEVIGLSFQYNRY